MPGATRASAAHALHASAFVIETNSAEIDMSTATLEENTVAALVPKRRILPTRCEVPLRALHEQCVARAQAQARTQLEDDQLVAARRHALTLVRRRRDTRKRAERSERALLDRAILDSLALAALASPSNSPVSDATLSDTLDERSTDGSDQGSDGTD